MQRYHKGQHKEIRSAKRIINFIWYLIIDFIVFAEVSLRLIVLKNGVRDISKAVPVVGPDLTNVCIATINL